jgi:hypothetical protein
MISLPRLIIGCSITLLAAAPLVMSGQTTPRDEAALIEFFEKKVRPVLVNNCYTCHSANTKAMAGLRVDDRNGLIQGGGRGPAVVPGHPEKSLLLQAINHTHNKVKMPPNKHLADEEIAVLTQWIKDGAAWPKVELPALGKYKAKYDKLRREHWAWQPLGGVQVPKVSDAAWGRADIDRFILAKLEEKGLHPVQDADRLTLLRRVTFDLTGLPPTPQEIEAFLKDTSAKAFAKVVDRLLASPALRRVDRLGTQSALPARLALPRLCDRRLQPRQAL